MLKNKKTYILIVIIIIIGLGLFARNKFSNEKADVNTVETKNIVVEKTVVSSGTIKAKKSANIAFSVPGEVEVVNVEEGQKVKKGDLLGQVYNYDKYQTSQSYKDALDLAKTDRDLYVENYSTNLQAVGGEDEYYIGLKKYNEAVEKAEATYNASMSSVYNSYANSPIDGTVVDVLKEQGEYAGLGETVFKIADTDNLLFEIEVDQEDFGLVRLGQKVKVTLDSYDNVTFDGEVVEVPLYANTTGAGTPKFIVKISVENKSETPALFGMDGDASILVDSTEGEVQALTFDSVFKDGDRRFVWINDNGVLTKKFVEIGLEGDIYTQIITPLDNLQLVVPESDTAKEGMQVNILN